MFLFDLVFEAKVGFRVELGTVIGVGLVSKAGVDDHGCTWWDVVFISYVL